jgi:hypothetical protein
VQGQASHTLNFASVGSAPLISAVKQIMRTFIHLVLGAILGVFGVLIGYWYVTNSEFGFRLDPVVKNTENKPIAINHKFLVPLEIDIDVAKDFVNTAFGNTKGKRFQSTTFLIEGMRTSQARQLIELVPTYNNFDGAKIASAVGKFAGRVSSIDFGREGSPVIYFRLPHWTHQRELFSGSEGHRISEEENMKLVLELRELFVNQLAADEFGVMPFSNRVVRVWWD